MRKNLSTPEVAPTARFFSQAVRTGNTIYVSGQVSMDRNGNVVGKGDMRAQARQTIENIRAILASAGATLDDVVKVTMYVTDMSKADLAREVRAEYFTKNPPASTGLEVKGLAHPDLMIEIESIAVMGE
jgi:reactive intermediate/imine deaminase